MDTLLYFKKIQRFFVLPVLLVGMQKPLKDLSLVGWFAPPGCIKRAEGQGKETGVILKQALHAIFKRTNF